VIRVLYVSLKMRSQHKVWLTIIIFLFVAVSAPTLYWIEHKRKLSHEYIESKVGYRIPEHWIIEELTVSEDKYTWIIDGGISSSWIDVFRDDAQPTGKLENGDIAGWNITRGEVTSSVMKRCMKNCCSTIEAPIN